MRDKHSVDPDVVLTDKDFAEIGVARAVWPRAKHQLCYWYMRKSVRERMALSRLSTAPYHPFEANAKFRFISMQFLPRCGPDRKDPDSEKRGTSHLSTPHVPGPKFPPTRLPTIVIPATQPVAAPPPAVTPTPSVRAIRLGNILLLPFGARTGSAEPGALDADGDDAHIPEPNIEKRAVFCPEDARQGVTTQMERHMCAHPLLPGRCASTPADIRFWAVKEMYEYCEDQELPELWAYLWEGWYRPSCWALWARSTSPIVPRLKTTMICESQYVIYSDSST
jgi:hypothetical protein